MTDVIHLGPATGPGLSIGGPGDTLYVGASFDREYEWLTRANCADTPLDFTGYTWVAEVLDATGAVIYTPTVTPSAGDTTGKTAVHIDPADTTTTLRDTAVSWRLRVTSGATTNNILIQESFKVT